MILPIVQYGDPILRQVCRKVERVDKETKALVDNMIETMRDANGVGLAAPQVGIDLQLAVVDVSHDEGCISYLRVNGKEATLSEISPLVFINPKVEPSEEKEIDLEGCLSIQGIRSEVKRPAELKAILPQLDGTEMILETDGLLARALQHEIDHLNGILFIDRLPAVAKVRVKNRMRRLAL